MDRVYKSNIPHSVRKLEALRDEFSRIDSRTNWTGLRIGPLLAHARALDRILASKEFSGETSRLRHGVEMFHADLVYLRTNIRALESILRSERAPARSRPHRPPDRR